MSAIYKAKKHPAMTPLLSFWHVFGIGNFVDPSHPTQVTGDHSQIKQIEFLKHIFIGRPTKYNVFHLPWIGLHI